MAKRHKGKKVSHKGAHMKKAHHKKGHHKGRGKKTITKA